jgi:hypothetical protein
MNNFQVDQLEQRVSNLEITMTSLLRTQVENTQALGDIKSMLSDIRTIVGAKKNRTFWTLFGLGG